MRGVLCLLGCLLLTAVTGGQPRPLPDRQAFLAEVRSRLDRDEDRQAGYSYVERRRRSQIDRDGRVRTESVELAESYPGLPGEGRWERVIERDGRPVEPAELARQDAARRKKVEQVAREMASRSPQDLRKAERAALRNRRETMARVDDVFAVYDLQMLGREQIEGHDTIAFSMNPRPDARPKTREGQWMRSFRGRGWVSERDYELVKLDVEAIRDVSVGLGFVGRLHKGTTFSFTRRKVNGDRWLPASATYTLSARILLFKRIRERSTTEYSGYRSFSVDTATTMAPAPGGLP